MADVLRCNREVGGTMIIRICFLLTLLLTSALIGQSGGTLEVTSDPAGTVVNLEGEFKLAGVTPTVFSQPLNGPYEVTAKREGYETYHTRINLTAGSPIPTMKSSPG